MKVGEDNFLTRSPTKEQTQSFSTFRFTRAKQVARDTLSGVSFVGNLSPLKIRFLGNHDLAQFLFCFRFKIFFFFSIECALSSINRISVFHSRILEIIRKYYLFNFQFTLNYHVKDLSLCLRQIRENQHGITAKAVKYILLQVEAHAMRSARNQNLHF